MSSERQVVLFPELAYLLVQSFVVSRETVYGAFGGGEIVTLQDQLEVDCMETRSPLSAVSHANWALFYSSGFASYHSRPRAPIL